MAQLDSRIILGAQTPDLVGAMASGNAMAQQVNQQRQQNQLAELYREQGAGILSGDTNALAALAGIDPAAALGIQSGQQQQRFAQNADARADRSFGLQQRAADQQYAMLNAQEQRAAADYAASIGAQQAAAEAAQLEGAIKQGMLIPDAQTWDQVMGQQQPDLVGQFDNRQALAVKYMSFAEILKSQQGPEYRPATAEEAAAYGAAYGQINTATDKFEAVNPPSGFSVETLPGGGTRVVQGPGATQKADGGLAPSSPEAMLSSIEGILGDEALPYATGVLAPLQSIPGTGARRVGSRIKQLDGQAFLQAFESLKGGGAITEIEGQKATQAIARLDSAQSTNDYVEALNELQDVLQLGVTNKKRREQGLPLLDATGREIQPAQPAAPAAPAPPPGWVPPPAGATPSAPAAPAQPGPTDDDLIRKYGG